MAHDAPQPFVSVIMPVRNERNSIGHCLEAFVHQTYPRARFEIVIADKSDDGTREILEDYARQFPDWLLVFDNPTGRIAEGYNIALDHSQGAIVNCYIGHAYPASDYIERIAEALARSDVDMVGGRVVPVPGSESPTAKGIATALRSRFTVGSNAFTRENACPVTSNHWMAVKREMINRVGGFNTRFPRGEDCDWYERMMACGATSLYDPAIRSFYFPRPTMAKQFAIQVINGWYRMRLFFATGRGLRFRHVLPILLLVAWCLIAIFLHSSVAFIAVTAVLYGCALTGVSTVLTRQDLRLFPQVWCAILLIHLGHVLGMLIGSLVFGTKALAQFIRS